MLPMPATARCARSASPIGALGHRPQAGTRAFGVETFAEDVRAETGERRMARRAARRQELDDGSAEAHGDEIRRSRGRRARGAPASTTLPRPIDVPRARHPHVGVQGASVVEVDEEVFAARLHGDDRATRERRAARAPAAANGTAGSLGPPARGRACARRARSCRPQASDREPAARLAAAVRPAPSGRPASATPGCPV